jgi:hypothetical protein
MKRALLFCFVVVFLHSLAGAQTTAPRELGVRFDGINFNGFNNFSLVYKKPKATDKYVRWRATYGQVGVSSDEGADSNFNFGAGLNFGIEKRKTLAEKFQFCRGLEYGAGLSFFDGDNSDAILSVGVRVGYVLGLQYNATKNVFVNLETIPGVSLGFDSNAGDFSVQGNVGFNSVAALTLGFRF